LIVFFNKCVTLSINLFLAVKTVDLEIF
jgi:hypothetical protein